MVLLFFAHFMRLFSTNRVTDDLDGLHNTMEDVLLDPVDVARQSTMLPDRFMSSNCGVDNFLLLRYATAARRTRLGVLERLNGAMEDVLPDILNPADIARQSSMLLDRCMSAIGDDVMIFLLPRRPVRHVVSMDPF
jgi:hypothetical protein